MLRKVIVLVISAIVSLFVWTCCSLKNVNKEAFKIKEAYYQTWIVSENEKGTDIMLELTKVDKGVIFDSIVFRGVRLKAFIIRQDNIVELKSILPAGKSRITNLEIHPVNLPDQLIYHYKGKRMSYPLKMIERKATKFY
jgi:hypothetical protein